MLLGQAQQQRALFPSLLVLLPLTRPCPAAPISLPLPLSLQVGGYAGILISVPTVLYQIAAYVVPGLTKSERQFLAPVILGSSVLFYTGCAGFPEHVYRSPVAACGLLLLLRAQPLLLTP
jgi:hypothetical protein